MHLSFTELHEPALIKPYLWTREDTHNPAPAKNPSPSTPHTRILPLRPSLSPASARTPTIRSTHSAGWEEDIRARRSAYPPLNCYMRVNSPASA